MIRANLCNLKMNPMKGIEIPTKLNIDAEAYMPMIIPKMRHIFPSMLPFVESIRSNAAAPMIAIRLIIPGSDIIVYRLLFSKIIPNIMPPMVFAFSIFSLFILLLCFENS